MRLPFFPSPPEQGTQHPSSSRFWALMLLHKEWGVSRGSDLTGAVGRDAPGVSQGPLPASSPGEQTLPGVIKMLRHIDASKVGWFNIIFSCPLPSGMMSLCLFGTTSFGATRSVWGTGPALVRERSIPCHSSAPHGVTCHRRLPLHEVIDSLPLPSPN